MDSPLALSLGVILNHEINQKKKKKEAQKCKKCGINVAQTVKKTFVYES